MPAHAGFLISVHSTISACDASYFSIQGKVIKRHEGIKNE